MPRRPARRRDPEATRSRILDQAERLFTSRGFAGVSIGDIAAAAKVGKSLVMHHGGSKAALWALVKQRRFAAYAVGQQEALERAAATPALLEDALRAYFLWLRANPGFLRLMVWRDLEQRDAVSEQERSLLDLGRRRLREAQALGWLRSDVDPDLALFALFSMLEAWFASGKRSVFVAQPDDLRYLDTVISLLRSGLLVPKGRT